jgi:hypothetical protein
VEEVEASTLLRHGGEMVVVGKRQRKSEQWRRDSSEGFQNQPRFWLGCFAQYGITQEESTIEDLDGMLPCEFDTLIGPHNLKSSCEVVTSWSRVDENNSVNKLIILSPLTISTIPGRLTQKKITLAESYCFTTAEYLYS